MDLAHTVSVGLESYGSAVYLLLFLLVAAEIGVAPLFFLPGDPLLFLCGALTVDGGLRALPLAADFFGAALLGSALAYRVGRLIGRRALQRPGGLRWLNRAALARAQRFFAGHGAWGLVLTPYVAVLRTFAPLAAGIAGMARGRFALATVAGAALWSGGLVAAGHFFGRVPFVREHLGALVLSGVALVAALALAKRLFALRRG